MAFFKKGVVLPQSLKKERKLAEIIEFDQKNVPEWHPSGLELSEDETVEMLAGMDKDNAADRETGENRSAPMTGLSSSRIRMTNAAFMKSRRWKRINCGLRMRRNQRLRSLAGTTMCAASSP